MELGHACSTDLPAQGIHNIAIVVPQFLVSAITAIIFALFDPGKSVLHGHHPGSALPAGASANSTIAAGSTGFELGGTDNDMSIRAEDLEDMSSGGPNALVVIFQCVALVPFAC